MAKVIVDKEKIQQLLSRGVEEVIDRDHLERRLLSGERLRVKFGVDPTGSVLHLGHALPLKKLQQFLDLGHQVVLLIGDFTATIGDPSGRLEERPVLSKEEVKKNMKEYLKQASKVLDVRKAEIKYNGKWYNKKDTKFFTELASKFTYARLMDRAEFKERIQNGGDITLLELMYPLLQGYDSVELKADVELGGTDQKFNLLMGRKVQKRYDLPEQDIITLSLLLGTDGEKKMSKTYDNYIALTDSAKNIFAKIMAIPDSLVWHYFNLLTDISAEELKKEEQKGEILKSKKKLAETITEQFYGRQMATQEREQFERVFSQHQLPQDIQEIRVSLEKENIVDLLFNANILNSKTEIKRLIEQKAIKIDGRVVENWNKSVVIGDSGTIIIIGPRKFYKFVKG